ncbi:MAG: hypothetical protein ACJ786_22125 [Catenulispora sp.]|jgi:positive regulator of sigma E activity
MIQRWALLFVLTYVLAALTGALVSWLATALGASDFWASVLCVMALGVVGVRLFAWHQRADEVEREAREVDW